MIITYIRLATLKLEGCKTNPPRLGPPLIKYKYKNLNLIISENEGVSRDGGAKSLQTRLVIEY